ncbi:hypothetical protein HMPREF3127_04660 [Sphingobacterium sp. HMSC13C05]|uniref:hypothetical protein n=1 Tax=Sphingobacterium sp. TaxID=341027 RepID=UPI0008A393F2|nr:hypothetical protein [Sphingobacterium sp.]OFV19514.1 hypothetical protein HMPREF3127_04660 [Sphingobacterium sp. HMSC13C05]
MSFFRKSRRPKLNPLKEKVAKSIAHRLVALQVSAAKKLAQWQSVVSLRNRNCVLLIIGILWLLYCIYILVFAIVG